MFLLSSSDDHDFMRPFKWLNCWIVKVHCNHSSYTPQSKINFRKRFSYPRWVYWREFRKFICQHYSIASKGHKSETNYCIILYAGVYSVFHPLGGYSHTWALMLSHITRITYSWSEVMAPDFEIFNPISMLHHNLIDSLFLEKNRFVSVSFSSRDTSTKSWSNLSPKCII